MVTLDVPTAPQLADINDVSAGDLPSFSVAEVNRNPPKVNDIDAAVRAAFDSMAGLSELPDGSTVALTAGSRGIADLPAILRAAVSVLKEINLEPVILAAMGSHGGATSEGQREMLTSLGITEASMDCPINSSMAVDSVGTDGEGQPVLTASDALAADAIVLVNRVKAHTDFHGRIESGLAKMAVIGMGKHRGAESAHNAALARGFVPVITDRFKVLIDNLPILGGLAIVENANERAAIIDGIDADEILSREAELLDRSRELLPTLPVDELDLLIVDRMGKDISGTGMDTNVLGRMRFHGQPEPDQPAISRIYVRSLTPASHGNALGVGLADFAHTELIEEIDLEEMYINIATSGEPARAQLPFIVPDDLTALRLACSTTGVHEPGALRVARIPSTLDPDTLLVSKPVAEELRPQPNITVNESQPLEFSNGDLSQHPQYPNPAD